MNGCCGQKEHKEHWDGQGDHYNDHHVAVVVAVGHRDGDHHHGKASLSSGHQKREWKKYQQREKDGRVLPNAENLKNDHEQVQSGKLGWYCQEPESHFRVVHFWHPWMMIGQDLNLIYLCLREGSICRGNLRSRLDDVRILEGVKTMGGKGE